MAYLLCRYADSIADTPLLDADKRLVRIRKFPDMIAKPDSHDQDCLIREISGSSSNIYEEKLLHSLPACLAAFEKLEDKQKKYIYEVVQAICRGMVIDLTHFPPENSNHIYAFSTKEDLENYCHLMGGAPGIFWSKLIEFSAPVGLESEAFCMLGRDIGDALQIVNILRDLPRDLQIGRCYLPSEELAKQGLQPQDLLDNSNSMKFEPVKQKWIAWGRAKLRSAYAYYAALPKTQLRHRAAIAWPVLWAADTLNKLSAEKELLLPSRHVKISRLRIYGTMSVTPIFWASNLLFTKGLEKKLTPKPIQRA